MLCPACNSALCPQQYGAVELDVCGRCHGIWLDSGALGPTLTAMADRAGFSGLTEPHKPCPPVQYGACPKCSGKMDLINYCSDSNVFVNICRSCRGAWLDACQFAPLIRYFKGPSSVAAFVKSEMENQAAKGRGFPLRSKVISLLIALGYLVAAAFLDDPESCANLLGFLLLPMAAIWFPDALAAVRLTFLTRPSITEESPPEWIAFFGWVLLLLPLIAGVVCLFI